MNYLKINGKKINISEETAKELENKFFSETEPEEENKLEIKNRFTDNVIYSSNKDTYKEVLEEAVENEVDLVESNLSGADLYGANLSDADLGKANLSGANLSEADLGGANLSEATLSEANLCGANLRGADLGEAELQNVKFYGKGGAAKIKKSQLYNFLKALGVILED